MGRDVLQEDAKLYGDRDPFEQGDWFLRHMHHMTIEGLHSKAAIAEELAHRDIKIDRLRDKLIRVGERLATSCETADAVYDGVKQMKADYEKLKMETDRCVWISARIAQKLSGTVRLAYESAAKAAADEYDAMIRKG